MSLKFNDIFSVTADTMLHCFIYEEEHPEDSKGRLPEEMRAAIAEAKGKEAVNEKA